MFTGIIEETGTLKKIKAEKSLLTLEVSAKLTEKLKKGASVAIDGVCFTVINKKGSVFTVQAMPETVKKTIVSFYRKGDKLNLELPIKVNSRLDGHFVLGHADGVGKVISLGNLAGDLVIVPPSSLLKFIAYKGSICVNGVSLTVSEKNKKSFKVSLIPETIKRTNLGKLKKGNTVNLEIDLLCRYMDNLKS